MSQQQKFFAFMLRILDTLHNVAPEDYPIPEAYIPYINEWMEADRKVPRKQRHTARRIYDRLCFFPLRLFAVGYYFLPILTFFFAQTVRYVILSSSRTIFAFHETL